MYADLRKSVLNQPTGNTSLKSKFLFATFAAIVKICSWKHLTEPGTSGEELFGIQAKRYWHSKCPKKWLLVPTSTVFSHSVYKYHSSRPPFAASCCFWVTWLACFSDWLAFMIFDAPLSSEVLFFLAAAFRQLNRCWLPAEAATNTHSKDPRPAMSRRCFDDNAGALKSFSTEDQRIGSTSLKCSKIASKEF